MKNSSQEDIIQEQAQANERMIKAVTRDNGSFKGQMRVNERVRSIPRTKDGKIIQPSQQDKS